jgi:hypothetical protein
MSAIDIFYLSLVLVAFAGFASALAYYTQRDRLPKGEAFPKRKSGAEGQSVKLGKAA